MWAALDEQVAVRDGGVDAAGLYRPAVRRVLDREGADPAEDGGEVAGALGRHVEDDEDGRRQVGREPGGEDLQRLDPAGRRADHDQVMPGIRGVPRRRRAGRVIL
jgi:hypothetical protein